MKMRLMLPFLLLAAFSKHPLADTETQFTPAPAPSANTPVNVFQQIEQAVRQDLQQTISASAANTGRHIEFNISSVDPRLTLAPCDQPLRINYDHNNLTARLSVQVQCRSTTPWSIYVPVQMQIWQKILVTQHAVNRGERLQADDIDQRDENLTNLRYGYYIDENQVIGQIATRNLQPGDILSPALLDEPQVISKGDAVIIQAQGAALAVRVPGVALSDGKVGQQISVRNSSSQRIVRAIVVSEGMVSVRI